MVPNPRTVLLGNISRAIACYVDALGSPPEGDAFRQFWEIMGRPAPNDPAELQRSITTIQGLLDAITNIVLADLKAHAKDQMKLCMERMVIYEGFFGDRLEGSLDRARYYIREIEATDSINGLRNFIITGLPSVKKYINNVVAQSIDTEVQPGGYADAPTPRSDPETARLSNTPLTSFGGEERGSCDKLSRVESNGCLFCSLNFEDCDIGPGARSCDRCIADGFPRVD